jgi:spore maturation protein CgeB
MSDNLRPGAFGDELSIVYCASKLNLGLLRRATCDRNTSDQVTARTFQVPATKSLLLHEDTPEVRNFFEDGTEVLLFNNNEEMIERITFALNSPKVREAICRGGYERCQRERYDYISAARTIISHFEMLKRRQNNPDSVRINLVTSKGTAGESTLVRK